jgi:hypothetical protein
MNRIGKQNYSVALFCLSLLIGIRYFLPKIFSARFFSSVNAFAGTEPTFINLNFKSLRNFLACVSLRSIPVNSLIFAAASPIERGGFSEKYCSIVHNAIAAYRSRKFQSLTYVFSTAKIINISHIINEVSI